MSMETIHEAPINPADDMPSMPEVAYEDLPQGGSKVRVNAHREFTSHEGDETSWTTQVHGDVWYVNGAYYFIRYSDTYPPRQE